MRFLSALFAVLLLYGPTLAAELTVPSKHRLVKDNGQWLSEDVLISKWFQNLKQPDNPQISCCGEADAYWADSFEVEGDHYVAIVTDERPDGPLNRPHIEPGTRVIVPNNKMKWDEGNPTGHGVIFIGQPGVYCYVAPGGV